MKSGGSAPTRGRPRAFDAQKAIDAAMRVFWKFGFEGASLPMLTKAMGINRPSLYAAFGNKEALFRAVLDRYEQTAGCMIRSAMQARTARETVRALMTGAIQSGNQGCMLVQAALACNEAHQSIRRELARRRGNIEHLLRERFERAVKEGDLPQATDVDALAKFFATVQHGLAVQLSSGAAREDLLAAVDLAMRAFPATG